MADSFTAPIPGESALLTIDVQEDFAALIEGTRECIPAMLRVVAAYRERGLPIIHVVRLYLPDGSNADPCRRSARVAAPGTDGAELVSALKPNLSTRLDAALLLRGEFQELGGNEWVMYKPRWDAFHLTPLEDRLRELGVTTVSVVGCNFPNCPRATIYSASMRDFRTAVFTDAISGIYERGVDELNGIGAATMHSRDCAHWLASIVV